MNAYELADEFDWMTEEKIVQWCNDVVNMLRQQADRISELEDRLSMYEIKDLDRGIIGRTKDYAIHDLVYRTTPQIKELSDEEIINLYKETKADNGGIREFVRAILKKASEK